MNIQKAISALKEEIHLMEYVDSDYADGVYRELLVFACFALEELAKYRQIGTVDECRAAREKMKPKKVTHEAPMKWCYTCPNCKDMLEHHILCENKRVRVPDPHCPNCGQALDWTESEERG